MDSGKEGEFKQRAVSSTSSSSSVTEYENAGYEESELEMSSVISIHVADNVHYIQNPLAANSMDRKHEPAKTLQNFSEASTSEENSDEFIPRGFRKMYLASLTVLLFAVCMGITATYSATATTDMKKAHSSIHPNDDEVTWIGSLMAVGALVGGTAGVIISRLAALLLILAVFCINLTSSTSFEDEDYISQFPGDLRPSLRQLLLQRALEPDSFEDNLSRIREAGLKRAHLRGLDSLPPGFVGVRGRKSEKGKVKDPFPGFLGVRGKKSPHRESSFLEHHKVSSTGVNITPVARYLQKEYLKLKNSNHP